MVKREADPMPDPELVYIQTGASILRQAMPILTHKQSEKLFREAHRVGEIAQGLAYEDFKRWCERQERDRQREQSRRSPPPQADGAAARLGVSPTATPEEIEAAWRRLARLYHPDHGGDHATMAQINADRDTLLKRKRAA